MRERLSINISVAKACFVRCNGCYNHFGQNANLVNTETILSFLGCAKSFGITKVTLCGGDPLSRPDILILLEEIKKLGFFIKLDTVGTALLGDTETIFFGKNDVSKVNPEKFASLVDLIGIPIDGSSNENFITFRVGRDKILDEQLAIIKLLHNVGAKICINTVVHKKNINEIVNIMPFLLDYSSIVKWQLFQFSPTGPLGYRNKESFSIDAEQFLSLKNSIKQAAPTDFAECIEFKANADRKGNYLLIDSDGLAWVPKGTPINSWELQDITDQRIIIGDVNAKHDHSKIFNAIFHPREVLPALLGSNHQQQKASDGIQYSITST